MRGDARADGEWRPYWKTIRRECNKREELTREDAVDEV